LSEQQHYLSTAIEFEDGHLEGQVFHVGTKAECERVANMMPGVAYSGPERVLGARVIICPNTEDCGGPMASGERWRMACDAGAVSGDSTAEFHSGFNKPEGK
jgi:hypothetical protein